MRKTWWSALVVGGLWLWSGCGTTPTPANGGRDSGASGLGVPDSGAPDAGCGCDAGRCLSGGGCGECEEDAHCGGPRPRCEQGSHRCVPCLLDAVDGCPAHQYCTPALTCLPGCSRGDACASGVCLPTHDCAGCEGDGECAEGRLCGGGACAASCSSALDCSAGRSCCGGRCVDLSWDVTACGRCDAGCAAGRFCARGACHEAVLAQVCQWPTATTVLDGIALDNQMGTAMAQALAASCLPAVSSATVSQSDGSLLNAVTGRPRAGPALLTVAGGSYGQRLVGYLEAERLATAYDATVPPRYVLSLLDGGVLVDVDEAALTPSHDFALLQVVRTPNGAGALVAAGFFGAGTQAGAWYLTHRVLPQLPLFTDAWYVVEWTDANGDLLPDGSDLWRTVASGR